MKTCKFLGWGFGKSLTSITKAPDRPHEVVAAAAELVVVDGGVTGTPGCVLVAEGVFGGPGTGVSNGSGQCLVRREGHQREELEDMSKLGRDELITNKNRATAYMSS